jgi:hypothetical protein
VVDYFQGIFHGDGTDGLILRERWLARDGLFDRLAANAIAGCFTGRCAGKRTSRSDRFAPRRVRSDRRRRRRVARKPDPEGC